MNQLLKVLLYKDEDQVRLEIERMYESIQIDMDILTEFYQFG